MRPVGALSFTMPHAAPFQPRAAEISLAAPRALWLNMTEVSMTERDMRMSRDECPDGRTCPVCGTRLPDEPGIRRCPRCGARALGWAAERPPEWGIVLFNARLSGIMAGLFLAMIGLLLMGYRFPVPWQAASIAMALPVAGYILFSAGARKVPRSWRTHYLVGVLALNAGLLVATMAAIVGLLVPLTLAGVAAAVAAAVSPLIRRAVAASARGSDA